MSAFKKCIIIGITISIITVVIISCNYKNIERNSNKNAIEVEWLAYQPLAQPDPDSPIVKSIEKKYGVKIKFWFIDNAKYEELLGVKLAAGDMPDIFRLSNLVNLPKYVQQGIAAEITDEMLAKAPEYLKSMEKYDFDKNAWVDAKINGKLYAFKGESWAGNSATTLVWRTDWLKNVGINKIPETLQEWETAMYKFTYDDPDRNGKNDTYGMSETTFSAIFGAFGAIPINRYNLDGAIDTFYTKVNNKVDFACTQPQMKEALKYLNKWYIDGVIDPEFITGENSGGYWAISQKFEKGRIGVTGNAMINHWKPPLYENNNGGAVYNSFIAANPNAKFGETIDLGKAPVGPNGKSGTQKWGMISNGGNVLTTKATKKPEVINFLFNLLNDSYQDKDTAILISYGIKDKTYTINKDGIYTILKDYSLADAQIKAGLSVFYISGTGNPDFDKSFDPIWKNFLEKYSGPGYANERAPQVEAKAKYIMDIQNFTVESYLKIITGEKPISYFDEYVAKVKTSLGGDIIMKETNETIKSSNIKK